MKALNKENTMKPPESRFVKEQNEFIEVAPYIIVPIKTGPHEGEERYFPNPDYFHAEYIQVDGEYKKRMHFVPRSNSKTL